MTTETGGLNEETTALILPEPVRRRGITEAQWRTLANNLYPGALPLSVLMVVDYCAARNLDPLKKPCHIVPMQVKDAKTDKYVWRDVVMPGIYEYRITAHRTGEYLGHDEATYGPEREQFGVMAPEWCKLVVYRWNPEARERVPFPVQVFFSEVVATRKDDRLGAIANARWTRAPRQMLAKCAEAAALREAFPEELGGEPTAEEMEGQRAINVAHAPTPESLIAPLDRLPEALRDTVEQALVRLGLTPAQRLVKITEFLAGEKGDLEEAAQKLLTWCQTEQVGRQATHAVTSPPPAKRGRPKKVETPAGMGQTSAPAPTVPAVQSGSVLNMTAAATVPMPPAPVSGTTFDF